MTVTAVSGDGRTPVAGATLALTFVPPAAEAAIAQVQAAQSGATILREAYSAETDARGNVVFEQLRAGRYTLSIAAPVGLASPGAMRLFDLADGQSAALTITLHKPGTITGRVIADGSPVAGVQIVPMQWGGPAGGPRQLMPVIQASPAGVAAPRPALPGSAAVPVPSRQPPPATGRDGRFGFGNLAPGEYYLLASPMYAPGRRPEFAPSYYPGSPLLRDAKPVVVRAAQETSAIDISLVRVKPGRVSVKAFASNGKPLPLGGPGNLNHVSLIPASQDRARPQTIAAASRPAGGNSVDFEVAPGDYFAVARMMTDEDPGTGDRPRGNSSDGRRFWDAEVGYEAVSVKDGESVTVNVQTHPGTTLSGRVVVEGPPVTGHDAPALPLDLSVVARPESYPRAPLGMPTQTSPVRDGAFTIKGVRGIVRLSVQGRRAVVKSIRRGAEDITAKAFELKGDERVSDIVITLASSTSRLEGTVANAPAEGGMVILFPEDRAGWTGDAAQAYVARVLRSVGMDATAPFAFPVLLPGRYLIVALSDTSTVAPIEPESLEKLRALATPVVLEGGETRKIELRIAAASRQ